MTTKFRRGQMHDRATHLHLVNQAAGDDFAEPWMQPSTRRPVHGGYPDTFASCTGPCEDGRKLCPSPEACQRAEPSEPPRRPLFADCPRASAAIGISLILAVGVLVWVLR